MTTATKPKRPTDKEIRTFGQNMTPVVNELLTTRLIFEHVSKLIDDNAAKIITDNEFRYHTQWDKYPRINLPDDRIVRNPKHDYMMADEDAARYHSLRADFVEQSGWVVPERGYCPALMADWRCTELEWQILAAMAELMQDERLKEVYGEHREEALNATIELIVNLSTYRKPTMPREWLGRPL